VTALAAVGRTTMNAVDMLGVLFDGADPPPAMMPKIGKASVPKPAPSGARTIEKKCKPIEYRIQGNWKRIAGVATKYELSLAVDALLERGKIHILDGVLHLARANGEMFDRTTSQERWAREDDELRAYCEQMHVHETRTARASEPEDVQSAQLFESVFRSKPRPGIGRYVLRELQHAGGGLGYAHVIETIWSLGGYEWVLEDPERVYRKPPKKAGK
jgi:hypothetical protein